MNSLEARGQLQRLGVEIDPLDRRSAEEILAFIQGLAVVSADVAVEVPSESSIIELSE